MMKNLKFEFYDYLIDSSSPYSNEYNSIKKLNPSLTVKQKIQLTRYFIRLVRAKNNNIKLQEVKKPQGFVTKPIIQSEYARRPGEKRIVAQLMKYDIISFDIYDTCLLRNVYDPRDIFQIMGAIMKFDNFKSARIKAEKEARLECYAEHGHDEITINDIYDILHLEYNLDYNWMQYEIELETYFTVSNLYMKRIFDKLISAGKTIIFTSDMYLPKEVIESILIKNGFKGYDKLFLSNEIKKSKKNGSMQEYIRTVYGIDKKIIHIGDNYRYDIKNSQIRGLDTIFYRSVSELSENYYKTNYHDIADSIYKAIVSNALMNGTWKQSKYYENGFKVGGILVAGYCEFLNNIVKKDNIDQILFCARDCDIISKIYQKYYNKVDSDYIYVSRYSLMNITPERYFLELYDRSVDKIMIQHGTVNDLLNSINIQYLAKEFEINHYLPNKEIKKEDVLPIRLLISAHLPDICSHNIHSIESARKYFKNIIGNHKRILIVDVGWTGSSANVLNYFLNTHISPEIYCKGALLFGSSSDRLSIFSSNGQIETYISDSSKNLDIQSFQFNKEDIRNRSNQVFEYIFSSIEGSTISYDLDNMGNPIVIKSQIPCNNPSEIIDMQNGMMAFVDKFEKYSKRIRSYFTISPYVAYAPFKETVNDEDYLSSIYSNFAYDAAIFQGKNIKPRSFGETFCLKTIDKRKVLLISHSFSYSGAPRSLLRICKVLIAKGYYCQVWSPHDGPMKQLFVENGAEVRIIKEYELRNDKIIRMLKETDFAIANTILTYDYYSFVKKYVPCVWMVREATNIPEYCNKYHNYKMYHCLKHSNDIVCVSEYAQQFIKKYSKNVSVLHNCVEDNYIKGTIKKDKLTFLQLGSIEPRKGYDILIDAFQHLPEELALHCELLFAGQIVSTNKKYAEKILDTIKTSPNISYLGEIRNAETLLNLEHYADVIVVASLDESCSLVALEATMMGKPLIVTENVGAKYMVTPENGVIVKTGSVESLQDALRYMANNITRLSQMGAVSRLRYEKLANMNSYSKDITALAKVFTSKEPTIRDWLNCNIFTDTYLNIQSAIISLINEGPYSAYSFLKEKYGKNRLIDSIFYAFDGRYAIKHYPRELQPQHCLIVSLTSYPKRIATVHECIKSILNQTLKPTHIIIYLSESEFINKENDLPPQLLALRKKGLIIKWCDNLKPHKKYYYAMKDNPDAILVTVDDDVIYDKTMLSRLYRSYLEHPDCVSCLRAHRIMFDELGSLKKYSEWKWEDNSLVGIPSHIALATGCSGVLYPPHLLSTELFNLKSITECTLMTDDLWLKIIEIISNVPVVLAEKNERLNLIDGSQDSAISSINTQDGNDNNFKMLIARYNNYLPDHSIIEILKESYTKFMN